MSWTASKVFRAFVADVFDNAAPLDLGADTFKVALYNDSITPDQDAASADAAYGGGVWLATGGPTGGPEVYETGQWEHGGQPLAGQTLNSGSPGVVFWNADDTASGAAADLSDVVGCLVYDATSTTVANQGVCYNWFGGANSVVNGTFTVIWASQGILRTTL